MGKQHVGGPREHEPAAPALCDRLAHLALERGELLGDGRGRQVQRVCRRRNRSVVGEGAQDAQPADVDHAGDLTDRIKKVALD
jgi:hypothetical protein